MLEKQSVSDQAASYLRKELKRNRWTGTLPGRDKLAREVGVHGSTIERALQQLEKEGLLKTQGPGKPRQIVQSARPTKATSVCILLYTPEDVNDEYILELKHHLNKSKLRFTLAPKSMHELKYDVDQIMKMVDKQSADAWIVFCGSREILERFLERPTPTFALFGRMNGLPIAGSSMDILTALRESIDCLYDHGHRRIVMLTRADIIKSGLGLTERTFVEELKKKSLPLSNYNLTTWDSESKGENHYLNKLFKVTPPTAIFVDHWIIYNAIQNYLARQQGEVFRKVTCVSMDHHFGFSYYETQPPHFYWDLDAVVRSTVKWVSDISRGKIDTKQKMIKAEFRGRESITRVD